VADDKPVTLPPWVRDAGKYLGIVAPMVFGAWLAFHDLQQDFALEQGKSAALTDRVVKLEDAKHAREIRDAALKENLSHIRTTLDKVNERLEKLLEAD
jgi:hypothetical protein